MISRRRSREFLLQMLYSRTNMGTDFSRDTFLEAYFEEENMEYLDTAYVDQMETFILEHEAELLSYISLLAPKFELETMPSIHILILMVALSEMLYFQVIDAIPVAVSVNEAIELAKRFSDDHGKVFINGSLSTFLKDREKILTPSERTTFRIF